MARPEEYNEEIAKKICDLIACGQSLRKICAEDDMPCRDTVFTWLRRHKTFLDQYAQAREEQMECYGHEILEIVDDAALTAESINKARLQADTRKWIMSKLKPKKYGDNQQLNVSGTIQHEQLIIQRTPKTIEHAPSVKELSPIDITDNK